MPADDTAPAAGAESDPLRPLILREPLTLQPLRRLERGGIRGLRSALVATPPALLLAALMFWLGIWPLPAALAVTLVVMTLGFVTGAATGRDELPPAAAMHIAADGVTAVREQFESFYPWSEVVDAQAFGTEIVLRLSGGHAFRVPFRERERTDRAMARIAAERKKHAVRIATHQRDPNDSVEPGDETRFIARQRQRLASGYRRGHESVTSVADELVDPDFPLQQRLGAAIALIEVDTPEATLAVASARDATASHALRGALGTLLEKKATDATLATTLRAMHPALRRFVPVGAPLSFEGTALSFEGTAPPDALAAAHDATSTDPRRETGPALRIAHDAPPQRIDDPDLVEQVLLHEAAIEEFEASSATSEHERQSKD